MLQKYSKKAISPKKQENENKIKQKDARQLLGNYCVWLSGRMHIGERLNEQGRGFSESKKTKNETKTVQT